MQKIIFILLFFPFIITAFDCDEYLSEIREDMYDLGECWRDTDCGFHSFGCVVQDNYCHRKAVSIDDEGASIIIDAKIANYTEQCAKNNQYLTQKCTSFLNDKKNNRICPNIRLMCVNGRCITRGHITQEWENDNYYMYR